jgi:polyisoprenoid-binding protein YceI
MSTITVDRPAAGLVPGSCWELDLARSCVEFHVKHFWGLATVKGHFEDFVGALTVAADGRLEIVLEIEAESLATGNVRRDAHLRSADFFDADNHPRVRFHSTRILDEDAGKLDVMGELEAAGRRVPLDFGAEISERGDELECEATTHVDQWELGMTYRRFGIRPPARLHVSARLRRQ